MDSFESTLYKAMSLCEGNILFDDTFSSIYTFTTENVNGYMKYFDFQNKSLLTVGSSDDQILNAFYYGARDITLFDVNPFAKYYIYLKICAILSLDYNEFQVFFFQHGYDIDEGYYNKNRFNKELYNKIKSTLRLFDYESFLFFDELFNLYRPSKISDRLLDDDECRNKVIRGFNIYLKNENNYNKLKNKLKSICFKYINGDIFKDEIIGKYDNIFLSNLCTWYKVEELKSLVEKMDNNLNKDGKMLFAYIYNTLYNTKKYNKNWQKIYDMENTKKVFKNYISEHHNIINGRSFIWEDENKKDLVLIYRKK